MALSFLAGLGQAAKSFQQGYEQSEDREALLKEREYLRQQREFEAGQRQRKLDEQAREDQFREGLAGIRTTDQVSEPAVGAVNGQAAPVLRDDEGNLMPGAVETKPAQTVTRPRNRDEILAEYAEIARKAGKIDQALKFDEQAAAESMKRGKALFSQWSSSTPDSANLEEAIKQATQIYNNDRLPAQVQGYTMNPDGSATVSIKNTTTGQAFPVKFKNVAELKQGMEGYYSPETLEAYRKSLREAAIKKDEKLFEYANDPSKRFQKFSANQTVFDAATNKIVQQGVKAGGTPIYDEDGNITGYTGGSSGAGGDKKTKGKSPADLATSAIMDAVKESAESKSLNADQLIGVQATARELVASATRSGRELDPYVAGKIALTAVLKPESVKPAYNQATGEFESTVSYNGNTFSVGRLDPSSLPESQVKAVAQSFTSKLPAASRAEYIRAASGDREAVAKINSDIAAAHGKEWEAAFRAAAGRAPTAQERQASIARTQAIVGQNIDLVRQSGAVEKDAKDREKAQSAQQRAAAQQAIGTPEQIMALPRGKAAEIYRQYDRFTTGPQREALQMKMAQDRRNISMVGGLRPQQ